MSHNNHIIRMKTKLRSTYNSKCASYTILVITSPKLILYKVSLFNVIFFL